MREATKGIGNKGFTFIEVLGAVVVLSIVFLAFMSLSGNWVLFEGKSANEKKALQIAEKHLREVQTDPAQECVPTKWPKSEGRYTVYCQITEMDSAGYGAGGYGPQHVSLQTVFLQGSKTNVATVTVFWGND